MKKLPYDVKFEMRQELNSFYDYVVGGDPVSKGRRPQKLYNLLDKLVDIANSHIDQIKEE